MSEQTIETVKIPSGTGIKMPNGDVCDPVYVSAKNLTKMAEREYRVILGWVESERKRAAAQPAEREALQQEIAARFREDSEAREASRQELKKREPWRF